MHATVLAHIEEEEHGLVPAPISRIPVPYLRHWRLDRLLTQGELARKSHVGITTIVRAEQGSLVNALTAAKLAKALGVSMRQLQEEPPQE